MADVNIDGVVTWLKNWFYDKSEMATLLNEKVNLNQNQANKNVVTDASGNITTEAKPTIDSALSTSSSRAVRNSVVTNAINGLDDRITSLESFELVALVTTQQWVSGTGQGLYYHPEEATLNKLYIVPKDSNDAHTNDGYDVYMVVKNGSNYSWEKLDDFDLNFDDVLDDITILDRKVTMTNAQGVELNETLYDRMSSISTTLASKGAKTDDVDWTYSSNGFTNGVKLVSKTDNANGRITLHLKS